MPFPPGYAPSLLGALSSAITAAQSGARSPTVPQRHPYLTAASRTTLTRFARCINATSDCDGHAGLADTLMLIRKRRYSASRPYRGKVDGLRRSLLAAPPPRNLYRVNVRCPIPMLTPRGEPAARAQVFVRRQVGRIPVQLTAVADAFEQTPRPASSSGSRRRSDPQGTRCTRGRRRRDGRCESRSDIRTGSRRPDSNRGPPSLRVKSGAAAGSAAEWR